MRMRVAGFLLTAGLLLDAGVCRAGAGMGAPESRASQPSIPLSASRLGPAFAEARGRTGLVPFLTAGYPSLDATLEMARGLARAGALAIEIGIPFSDPIADGPEIQRASECALRQGVSRDSALDVVRELRRAC